jgi:hypothetical protein
MKKIYLVFDDDLICQYTIEIETVNDCIKYILKCSDNSEWTHPGETLITVLDTGNGFEFSDEYGGRYDYHVFEQQYILMSFIKKHDDNLMPNYTFVSDASLTKLD